jgi:hypothetical protein
MAQSVFLSKLMQNYDSKKNVAQLGVVLSFSKKSAQNKQAPDRRKFAQSGHPAGIQASAGPYVILI